MEQYSASVDQIKLQGDFDFDLKNLTVYQAMLMVDKDMIEQS